MKTNLSKEQQQELFENTKWDVNYCLKDTDATKLLDAIEEFYEKDPTLIEDVNEAIQEITTEYLRDPKDFDINFEVEELHKTLDDSFINDLESYEKKQEEVEIIVDCLREDMGRVSMDDNRFNRIEDSLMKSAFEEKNEELENKYEIIREAQRSADRGENQFEVLEDTVNKIESMDKKTKTRERDNSQSM